jgi:dTDP-4-amino-4,6-dideoxygalactose transaminase
VSSTYVVGKPKIVNKELFLKRASEILDSGSWGNNSTYVLALEDYIKEYLGCKHVIAVNSATTGLELAIQTLKEFELFENPTCLIPSFTFTATASALVRNGIKIEFGDIDNNFCLNKSNTDNITADFFLPVNLFGETCHPDIQDDSRSLLFDQAHSIGVFNERTGKYLGADTELNCFSLHSTKMVSAGECGFITTSRDDYAEYLKELRNFGYDSNSGAREGDVIHIGTNGKISEITAALALTQLENIQEIQEHYFNVHQEYERLLPNLIKQKNNMFSNWSYVVVQVDARKRDSIISRMNQDGIFPRTYFKPLHHMSVYKENINLPMTNKISSEIMCLPTGLTISLEDVQYISRSLANAIKEG